MGWEHNLVEVQEELTTAPAAATKSNDNDKSHLPFSELKSTISFHAGAEHTSRNPFLLSAPPLSLPHVSLHSAITKDSSSKKCAHTLTQLMQTFIHLSLIIIFSLDSVLRIEREQARDVEVAAAAEKEKKRVRGKILKCQKVF